MTDIRSLEQTLLENLPWNKARIKFIARFLLALYAVQTAHLSDPHQRAGILTGQSLSRPYIAMRCKVLERQHSE